MTPTARGSLLAARAVALTAIETPEDPPAISAEAVRITPEDDTLARARVLTAHAFVLAMFWRHDEAQQVGLDALALAEQLDRTDLASEVITTLSGLRRAPAGSGSVRRCARRSTGRSRPAPSTQSSAGATSWPAPTRTRASSTRPSDGSAAPSSARRPPASSGLPTPPVRAGT